jgi:biopolymer transport protein ExbD
MRTPNISVRSDIELQLTPMIDVVFLLLVFFLWTSSFEEPEFDLPSALAEPPLGLADSPQTPSTPEVFDEIVIRVSGTPTALQWTLNGTSVTDLQAMFAQLQSIVELGVQPPVVIDPDVTVEVGDVIDVYDTARRAGLLRVLFAASMDANE